MKKKRRLQRSDKLWLGGAALMVLLQFWWLPGERRAPDDTFSTSIEGKRGFYDTLVSLSEAGVLPEIRRENERLVPEEAGTLLILSPDRYPDKREQDELADYVRKGNALLFAPNWVDADINIPSLNVTITESHIVEEETVVATASGSPGSASGSPGTETLAEADDDSAAPPSAKDKDDGSSMQKESDAQAAARRAAKKAAEAQQANSKPPSKKDKDKKDDSAAPRPSTLPSQSDPLDDLEFGESPVSDLQVESQLIEGPVVWRTRAKMSTKNWGAKTLIKSTYGTIQVASWKHGSGRVVVSASPDVFSNRAMLNSRQAELAVRLVEYTHSEHYDRTRPIIVCEYLNASQSYQQTGVLMSPSLRSGSLQLLLVTFLVGWFGFHRFGPARRDSSKERRSLEESANAVGNLFYRTGSGGAAVAAYLDYARSQIRKSFGNSVQLTDFQAIALRTGQDETHIAATIENAIALSKVSSGSPSACAAAIRGVSDIVNHLRGQS